MRFHKEIVFTGPMDVVAEMLADTDFRERVAHEAGATSADVTVTETDGGMEASVETRQPATEFPAIIRKVIGDELAISQVERWTTRSEGEMEVGVRGMPGHVRGTVSLAPRDGGTVQTVDAEVKVSVPLVGGKAEKLIGQVLGNVLKLQARVGNEWLAGDR